MNHGSPNTSTRTLRGRRRGRPRTVHPGGILPGDTVVRWSSDDRYRLWSLKNQPEHKNMSFEEFQKLGYFPGRTWAALSMAYSRVQRRLERGQSVGLGLNSLKRPRPVLQEFSDNQPTKRVKHENEEGIAESKEDVDISSDEDIIEDSSQDDYEEEIDYEYEDEEEEEEEEETDDDDAIPATEDKGASTQNPLAYGPQAPPRDSSSSLDVPNKPMLPPPPLARQTSTIPLHNEPAQSTSTSRQPSIPGTPTNAALPDQFFTHAVQNLIQCAHSLAQHKTYVTEIKSQHTAMNTTLKRDISNLRHDLSTLKGELKYTKGELRITQKEFSDTKGELRITQKEFSDTKGELSATKTELNNVKDELKQIKESDSTKRLQELEDKVNGMQSSSPDKSAELETIKAQMTEFQRQFRLFNRLQTFFNDIKNTASTL